MNTITPIQPATRTPSPLDAIVHEAAHELLTLRMTKIVGAGDKIDTTNIIADLDVLCRIFDGVILEVGKYAGEALGLSSATVAGYFQDQLRNALEGNALFELEQAGEQATEHLRSVI